MHIQFLHLFTIVKEGEIYEDSLIAFAKDPYMTHAEDGDAKTQYRYKIYLNLYLVRIRFIFLWPTKFKKDFPIVH